MRLVGLVQLMAKIRPPRIKGDADKLGRFLPQDPEQDIGEPVNRMGGQATLVGERGDGVVGPVDIGAGVDEVNRFWLAHGA